ncbi:MAG: hypothetical protein QOI61_1985 [Actinomycetota bacterium]
MLRSDQYADASNLDARSAIYAYAEPRPSLHDVVVGLVPGGVTGRSVLDVGCGPGGYANAFAAAGCYVGVDLSEGMVAQARERNGVRDVGVVDAQRLPVRDDAFDVVLAMHMLYHVPDRALAIDELARVVRDDGVVLAVTNAPEHQAETRAVEVAAYEEVTGRSLPRKPVDANFDLSNAPDELARCFDVAVVPYGGVLTVPEAAPVVAYINSARSFVGLDDDAAWAQFLDAAGRRIEKTIATDGAFRITTSAGVLVCRPR